MFAREDTMRTERPAGGDIGSMRSILSPPARKWIVSQPRFCAVTCGLNKAKRAKDKSGAQGGDWVTALMHAASREEMRLPMMS